MCVESHVARSDMGTKNKRNTSVNVLSNKMCFSQERIVVVCQLIV